MSRSQSRRVARLAATLTALVVLSACASRAPDRESSGASGGRDAEMTASRMEVVFASQVDAIEGPPGAIRTQVDGVNVYLISDPANDRMRIVAPIAMLERLDPRVMPVLLEANFHSTLDARYAVSEGIVYATFLHPISSLSPELIGSALHQVVSLAKTFGTTFSSGSLHFGSPSEGGD